jgi:hypothetical protein
MIIIFFKYDILFVYWMAQANQANNLQSNTIEKRKSIIHELE